MYDIHGRPSIKYFLLSLNLCFLVFFDLHSERNIVRLYIMTWSVFFSSSFSLSLFACQRPDFLFRISHWRSSVKKVFLKNFSIFIRKHQYWSLFLIKLHAFGPNFIKIRFQHRYFPINVAKFLEKPILKNISERYFYLLKRLCWTFA